MPVSLIDFLKIKAKLLQKMKQKAGKAIPLKEAFRILAQGAGYSSWRDYKKALEDVPDLCPAGTSALWKTWYSSYEEALRHIKNCDGYLLPYQKHYFVCELNYIEALGIEQDDSDLKAVGKNWVEPKDKEAWERLVAKIKTFSGKEK